MTETTLYPLWKEAVRAVLNSDHAPGVILKTDWLREQFGLKTPVTAADQRQFQLDWMGAFNSFRDCLLREHKICLRTIHNGAYEIIRPGDQTELAESTHMKAIHRELRHMVAKMTHVNHEALTDEERRKNADGLARAAHISGTIRNRRRITFNGGKQ
jgi:hypothetical protein